MGVQYPTQDWHTLALSEAQAEATYTYDLQPLRSHRGVAVLISNTAETGTSTLDAKLQYEHPDSLVWTDVPGASFVQWGDGSTGEKFLMVYPGLAAGETDNVISLATDFKIVGIVVPRVLRLAVTVGGTSVTRTYSAGYYELP
jgi:hypothetical protein